MFLSRRFLPLALVSALALAPGCTDPGTPPEAPVPSGKIEPWPLPSNESALIHVAGEDDLTSGTHENITWYIHLDVFQDGQTVVVPANIGIDWSLGFVAPIHTHLAAGEVDVESPVLRAFTLGEFFTMWGVSLTGATVYLNGVVTPDPTNLLLANHQEIAVVFGTPPASIPKDYPSPSS